MRVDFNPKDYIDGFGYANFRAIRSKLRHDWDYVNVVVGRERSGKSTLAKIICSIVDDGFDLKRVAFSVPELKYVISRAKPYQAVDHDEGAEAWLSTETMSGESRQISRAFMEMGYKNLFVNITLPDVSLLHRYIKSHRAASLLRVTRRGRYYFYSAKRIKRIKKDGTTKAIIWPKPNFKGTFSQLPATSTFWSGYLSKAAAFKSGHKENPKLIEEQLKIEEFKKNTVTLTQAEKILGLNKGRLHNLAQHGELKRRFGIKPTAGQFGARRITTRDVEKLKVGIWGKNI